MADGGAGVVLQVDVEIVPDKLDDFMKAITVDVEGSRREAACLRFDLLRDQLASNKFAFHEVYKDQAALDFHREQPHFQAWKEFGDAGGVISKTVSKYQGVNFKAASDAEVSGCPVVLHVVVDIVPDRLDEFMKAITVDVEGSRQEAGCLRFDLLRDSEVPTKFAFHEVYRDQAAVDFHRAQPHFKVWQDFSEAGGVVQKVVSKYEGLNFKLDCKL
eukprot:gnl/TRDRNA2_/TRDRNA2_135213_c0_seq2.p1 gnl/TRDRNA2_/TRDRNA2_135213_c0~~gnl/TRDRNA2_/TRDRNA2_135213_c0_seq2.p1  ORF type:complete len:230 (+),score=63.22 gnl/TRDRNA2_/TRDRNA2_135213_c0_seq2:44-691(+)